MLLGDLSESEASQPGQIFKNEGLKMGRIVPSAVLRRQIEDSWILLLVSPLWLSLLSLNACKRMHSKHTSAEIGWSASQTLRDGADVASLGRNYTETSEHHTTNAKQWNPQERPFTEALEGSQVTVQRPPSVQGLSYILGGHPRLIASRLIPLQEGAEVVRSSPFTAGRSRA